MFRLGYNQYLKELDIEENDYPFDVDMHNVYDEESGFNDYLTYSLNWNLVIFTYCYLRRMHDVSKETIDWDYHKNNGEFDLEKALYGLREYIKAKDGATSEIIEKFRESWNYIGEHSEYLWW